MEYNTNTSNYDYIEDQDHSAAVCQEAVPYHSTGPDISKSIKTASTKPDQSSSTGNEPAPSPCEAPTKQKFRVCDLNFNFAL